MRKGKTFIITGPSGVGKGTIIKALFEGRDDLYFSVSATTRAPRPGEVEGQSYYFIDKERFLEMIRENAFVEYDEHMGNFYGTPKFQLAEKLKKGSVILDIEPNGAFNVKAQCPDAVLIFIAPPSPEELERRLRGRGDTSEEQIRIRQDRVRWEMEQSKKYDHIVINDRVETCVEKILGIIDAE